MQKVINPIPIYLDARGALLDGGKIYIGAPGADPELNPIQVYFDEAGTIPASQPIRTIGGLTVNNSIPTLIFVNADDYSERVRAYDDTLVTYSPSVFTDADQYQPRNADLTKISNNVNTDYGIGILTLANQTELQEAVNTPPFNGGTINNAIIRKNLGQYMYNNDPRLTDPQWFFTGLGAEDPTTEPGQFWVEYDT